MTKSMYLKAVLFPLLLILAAGQGAVAVASEPDPCCSTPEDSTSTPLEGDLFFRGPMRHMSHRLDVRRQRTECPEPMEPSRTQPFSLSLRPNREVSWLSAGWQFVLRAAFDPRAPSS